MRNTTTPTTSVTQADKCEDVVIENKLLRAMKQLKTGSGPGCDGNTV